MLEQELQQYLLREYPQENARCEWKEFKNILPIRDGVSDVATDDAQVVAAEYHDLAGRRLEAPAERGITIRTDIYSDGTRRCTKMLR